MAMDHEIPLTPVRDARNLAQPIHDSPFSDYFTDEARSVSIDPKATYNMPSNETQRLLLRLNNLGAQILRHDPGADSFDALSSRLDDLEDTLCAPDAQTRQPAELVDSGLFMEDEDEDRDIPTPSDLQVNTMPLSLDSAMDIVRSPVKPKKSPNTRLLKQTQALRNRVTKANTELRQRFEEMRALNDQHITQIEESTREVLTLRSETESLRSDLAFDHSELLFLKLQLKALEVQADGLLEQSEEGVTSSTERKQRVLLQEGMQQWKADWDDVDARLRSRRDKHGVKSSTPTNTVGQEREDGRDYGEEGDWMLDMCNKRQGRVQSITIKRLNSMGLDCAEDGNQHADGNTGDMIEVSLEATRFKTTRYHDRGCQTELSIAGETAESETVEGEQDSVVQVTKTPWQQLWDDLASLAGTDRY